MREHRVVGPPGTGKTTYLKRQFENATRQYSPADLFACSLTRAAAHELASRVHGVPERNIGTLHSHAFRALKYPKIVETTAGLKEWNEYCGTAAYRIGTQHAANPENAPAEPLGPDSDGVKLMQDMGVLRQRMVDRAFWPSKVKRFADRWDAFKLESNKLDFTDLIEAALASVDSLEGCRVMFVDEAQDMSKLEFALVRKWGKRCDEFVIVGDPDQNLYEWRGSDPAAFYAGEVASERVLEQSYRVPAAVHEAAVRWIGLVPDRKPVGYRPTSELGSVGRLGYTYKNPEPLIEAVLTNLDRSRSERDTASAAAQPPTAMVLASCGYMLQPFVAKLREQGVLYHNPYRAGFHAWNPLTSARRLVCFLRPDPSVWGSEARIWTWGEVQAWSEVLQSKGTFVRGFKSAVELRCAEGRFGTEDTLRDEPVDIAWLLGQCTDDATRQAVVNCDIDWYEDRLRHNDRKSQSYALTVARRHGADRLLQPPRIIVGTIHSVKGGEASDVYLFPDLSTAGYWGGWKRGPASRSPVVRQYYVGMTRAKENLYLLDQQTDMAVTWLQ